MKVWVTLDMLDGTSKVAGPLYPDEIDTRGMLMRLAHREFASITFTNAEPLRPLIKQLNDQLG